MKDQIRARGPSPIGWEYEPSAGTLSLFGGNSRGGRGCFPGIQETGAHTRGTCLLSEGLGGLGTLGFEGGSGVWNLSAAAGKSCGRCTGCERVGVVCKGSFTLLRCCLGLNPAKLLNRPQRYL